MRVLFAANPEKSIVQYQIPLAWAMRSAGHEVRFASQPSFTGIINQAGLTAVPVGRDQDLWRIANMTPDEREAERADIPAPYDVVDRPEKATWPYLRDGYTHHVRWWHRMDNFPIIADLVAFARAWKPDLVIWEPLTYAGAIAAKACDATHARLLFGIDVFGVTRDHYLHHKHLQPPTQQTDPLAEWLTAYATKYNTTYTEDMTTGNFTINQFPPSLQTTANLPYLHMQYTPYGGPATIPPWLRHPPEKPRVALTMGLSATERFTGYPVNIPDIIHALADLDIELVATLPTTEKEKLTTIPPNTRITPYVPLHALAPTCTAVIHHAGAATLATTSLHAKPQLAIPYHYDQPTLARKLHDHGAGIALHATHATGQNVRDNLTEILTNPTYHHHATRLAHEIHTLPTPNQIIPHIQELTTTHKPR